MEYVQMTLDEWVNLKESLKNDLNGVAESFVRIGYALRKIKAEKLYKNDGYESMESFANAEYGLTPSTVSRFMSINERYSIDGNSERLRPEFAGIGSSKLAEMLQLPDKDLELIRPETTRDSIRDLKQFNRETSEETDEKPSETAEILEVIEKFYQANPDILNKLYSGDAYLTGDMEELIYIINPAGNRTYRKGVYFIFMYDQSEGIKIKKFGQQEPITLTWAEWLSMTQEIFEESAAGDKTYFNHFGYEPVKEEPKLPEPKKASSAAATKPAPKKADNKPPTEQPKPEPEKEPKPEPKKVAPAQEKPINPRSEEDFETEKVVTETQEIEPAEVITIITRKDYLDGLTAYGMAAYIAGRVEDSLDWFSDVAKLEEWLLMKVDEYGEEVTG